ncbi:MAG: hypothetical protein NZ518_10235 [Dehalococcoidia bacterium]|nr:hypothetical protein [Dehalococcoidia bacterium]
MTATHSDSPEVLRQRLAQYEQLLAAATARRQAAIAEGNREIAGKIHQAEREWQRRIADLRAALAALDDTVSTR